MPTRTYRVTGMSCDYCVNAVRAELTLLPGVADVNVDLASRSVTVTSDTPLDSEAVAAAVAEAGYELAS